MCYILSVCCRNTHVEQIKDNISTVIVIHSNKALVQTLLRKIL